MSVFEFATYVELSFFQKLNFDADGDIDSKSDRKTFVEGYWWMEDAGEMYANIFLIHCQFHVREMHKDNTTLGAAAMYQVGFDKGIRLVNPDLSVPAEARKWKPWRSNHGFGVMVQGQRHDSFDLDVDTDGTGFIRPVEVKIDDSGDEEKKNTVYVSTTLKLDFEIETVGSSGAQKALPDDLTDRLKVTMHSPKAKLNDGIAGQLQKFSLTRKR